MNKPEKENFKENFVPDIQKVDISNEMESSYLQYALSVILSRAIPDVRDGLKSVHRRIVFSMSEEKCYHDRPHRKSSRVVGDVMGKYHPHGDASIYDAMARMAQEFSLRIPLLDGQGNFGAIDGSKAAASRYTEIRMAQITAFMCKDIDKGTVDFVKNYDNTLDIPKVLPSAFPNILANGTSGIAVGMATNIPPHNLGELFQACYALLDNMNLTVHDLMAIIKAPDFPTGGILIDLRGVHKAYQTGSGNYILRARYNIEEDKKKNKSSIIFTEIPYQVNLSSLMEQIADLVNGKEIENISDLRDESNYKGVRVVIELKKDANVDLILKQLFARTQLQVSQGIHLLVIDQDQPKKMSLDQILKTFINFRIEIVRRRTRFYLKAAREKYHVLLGLVIAVSHIDEIVNRIKTSASPQIAKQRLLEPFWTVTAMLEIWKQTYPNSHVMKDLEPFIINGYRLSEIQAKAILEMRLQNLTGLEHEKLMKDLEAIAQSIEEFLNILNNHHVLLAVIRQEFMEIDKKFSTPRRTTIELSNSTNYSVEDLMPKEDMVVSITMRGYIKHVPLKIYRAQHRGGKGQAGMAIQDADNVTKVFAANTHTSLLFFTTKGMVYRLKVYQTPLASLQGKGKPVSGLLSLKDGDALATVLPLELDVLAQDIAQEADMILDTDNIEAIDKVDQTESLFEDEDLNNASETVAKKVDSVAVKTKIPSATGSQQYIIFVTSKGHIRRNNLLDFHSIRISGKIAMKFTDENEKLLDVRLCSLDDDVVLITKKGRLIRFSVQDVREFSGRDSVGVRGIKMMDEDEIVAMNILTHTEISIQERESYFKIIRQKSADVIDIDEEADLVEMNDSFTLTDERLKYLEENEQWLLTISSKGFGKRTSSYAYRTSGRACQGIAAMDLNNKTGELVVALPVKKQDQILLVTSNGRVIRSAVSEIRQTSRKAQGVSLCRLDKGETVIFAYPLSDVSFGVEEEEEVLNEIL